MNERDEFGGIAIAEPERDQFGGLALEAESPTSEGVSISEQRQLDAATRAAFKTKAPGFLGSVGRGFQQSLEATSGGVQLPIATDKELGEHLLKTYSELENEEGQPSTAGQFIGGFAGTVAQAFPIGLAAAPGGPWAERGAMGALFGSQQAYSAFMHAGVRALAEGKSVEDAVNIARKSALVGAGTGAGLGAIMRGRLPNARAAAAEGLKLGLAAAAGQTAQNLAEQKFGLQTPTTEGVLQSGLTMGALPLASHALLKTGRALYNLPSTIRLARDIDAANFYSVRGVPMPPEAGPEVPIDAEIVPSVAELRDVPRQLPWREPEPPAPPPAKSLIEIERELRDLNAPTPPQTPPTSPIATEPAIDVQATEVAPKVEAEPTPIPPVVPVAPAQPKKEEQTAIHPITDYVWKQLFDGQSVSRDTVHQLGQEHSIDPKQAEEFAESGLVAAARDIAHGEGTPIEKYRKIVDLYNRAPSFTTRTVESKQLQAYSTPPPLAYLASQLADVRGGQSVLEPTAGHGMLLIDAASGSRLHGNELDTKRWERLKALYPDMGLSGEDAVKANFEKADRLIANPPFGNRMDASGKAIQFPIKGAITSKTTTPSIDLAIAFNALHSLKPNGKAVLILGAKTGTPSAQISGDPTARAADYNRPEFLQLFKQYNVTDWFTVGGNLYDKMGAGWPVDVIVIDGKRPTEPSNAGGFVRPWINPPQVYTSWPELESKLYEHGIPPKNAGGSSGGTLEPTSPGGIAQPARPATESPTRSGQQTIPVVPDETIGRLPERPVNAGNAETPVEPKPTSQPPVRERPGTPVSPSVAEPTGEVGEEGTTEAGTGEGEVVPERKQVFEPLDRESTGLNAPYVPTSKNGNPKLVAPSNIADAMRQALADLEHETGKAVDEYVAEQLGWTKDQLFDRLSAAQIDSVALAIRNINRGTALITGDQMGVGKGRQVAALIEYARRNGIVPVFVTAKPNLYSDMAGRDLPAIGVNNFTPFITNTDVDYLNGSGEQVANRENKVPALEEIARTGRLPQGYDGIFTTYDQLKSDKPPGFSEDAKAKAARKRKKVALPDGPRLAALRAIAPKALFILDESHLAAGTDSNLFLSLSSILPTAKGAFFASATYAKRPDNMGLYAGSTNMRLAGLGAEEFVEMMKRGGNPLQQALASMLTSSGEFVRREQDWSDVKEFVFKKATADAAKETEAADTYTSFLRDLMKLSEYVQSAAESATDAENQVRGEGQEVNLTSVQWGSRLFNLSQQYLLALRADAVASEAISLLQENRKPFIVLNNTMAGPISDLIARGLPVNFGGILLREMRKMLEITIKDPMAEGGKRHDKLSPEQLPDGGEMYHRIENQIKNTDFGAFPISPIDYIKQKVQRAGFSIGEITGRDTQVDEEGKVAPREKARRNAILSNFNDRPEGHPERVDALIANKAGLTGLSAHTDPRFKDQRQRVFVGAQMPPDINDAMQAFGRVMRFGQTKVPAYRILQSSLAAERRFMTMLRKKMASLNANTSADTESGFTTKEGIEQDIFNQVGDDVVRRVMESNPDLAELAEIEVPDGSEGLEGFAQKATGRFVLLPNEDAEKLWKQITDEFNDTIRALDEVGENPLRATVENLKAKTLKSEPLVEGSGKDIFSGPANLETVKVVANRKPMTHIEAAHLADKNIADARQKARDWIQASRQAEQQRLATAEARGATATQLDRIRNGFNQARQAVQTAYSRIGQTYGVDPTGSGDATFYGVVTDISLRDNEIADFASPSRQQLVLAVNTARRVMKLPLSQTESGKILTEVPGAEELFDQTAESVTERQIITGNILRGYAEAIKGEGMTKPRVMIYTKEDGSTQLGILMPIGSKIGRSGKAIRDAAQFQQSHGEGKTLVAGEIELRPDGTLSLPSNSRYKPLWGHPDFRPLLVGEYARQIGTKLIGKVRPEKLQELFDLTKALGFGWSETAPEPKAEGGKGIAASAREKFEGGKWTSATGEGGFITLPTRAQVVAAISTLTTSAKHAAQTVMDIAREVGQEMKMRPMTDQRRAVLNWSAKHQRSFQEAGDAQREIMSKAPNATRREGITNWIQADGDRALLASRMIATTNPKLKAGYEAALTLTPEEISVANDVRRAYRDLGLRAQHYGVLNNFKDNYVTQIWNIKKGPALGSSRTLKDQFRFAKARSFDTFFDGEQAGYTPKTKDIAKLLPVYIHEMNSVISARQLVEELARGRATDGRPLIARRGIAKAVNGPGGQATLVMPNVPRGGTTDYKTLENQPALHDWIWAGKDTAGNPVFEKGDLALHPEAYKQLKNVLGRSAIKEWYGTHTTSTAAIPKLLVKGLDRAQSETKQTMLGVLAPFHQVQEATHAIGHRVNPLPWTVEKPDLVNNPAHMDAARHGLMIQPDRTSANQFMEGLQTSGLVHKIPLLGQAAQWYQHYLFHEYIPGLKLKTYQAILNRNLRVYANDISAGSVSIEDVKALSAEQTNAAYGHLNYADLARNPTIQHMMRLGLLAPDFLEARARFAGQSIKGLGGGKVGREQLLALATLALAQAITAYVASKLTGGEWEPTRPFEFRVGNRRYTMRSVPEDISSLLHDPWQFFEARESPIIGKGLTQVVPGVDWAQRKTPRMDLVKEIAQSPIPLTLRGFLGIGNTSLNQWEQLLGSVGLKISRYVAPEIIKRAELKELKERLIRDARRIPPEKRGQWLDEHTRGQEFSARDLREINSRTR